MNFYRNVVALHPIGNMARSGLDPGYCSWAALGTIYPPRRHYTDVLLRDKTRAVVLTGSHTQAVHLITCSDLDLSLFNIEFHACIWPFYGLAQLSTVPLSGR